MTKLNRKPTIAAVRAVILTMVLCFLFSSCILTLGSPLARKVRADTFGAEGGGGIQVTGEQGYGFYGYTGFSIRDYVEIGLLPLYLRNVSNDEFRDLDLLFGYVPVRVDLVNFIDPDFPLHVVPFVGPGVQYDLAAKRVDFAFLKGIGLSLYPIDFMEIAASVSLPGLSLVDWTVAGEVSLFPNEHFRVGVGLLGNRDGGLVVTLSAGYLTSYR